MAYYGEYQGDKQVDREKKGENNYWYKCYPYPFN